VAKLYRLSYGFASSVEQTYKTCNSWLLPSCGAAPSGIPLLALSLSALVGDHPQPGQQTCTVLHKTYLSLLLFTLAFPHPPLLHCTLLALLFLLPTTSSCVCRPSVPMCGFDLPLVALCDRSTTGTLCPFLHSSSISPQEIVAEVKQDLFLCAKEHPFCSEEKERSLTKQKKGQQLV